MAVTDYNRLTAITRAKIIPKIVDQIGVECEMLGRIFKMATKMSGGTTITQPVKYRQNSQGGYYSGLELLDSAQETTRTRASWEWKQYHKPIVINNIEQAQNKGEEGVIDLMEAEMEDMKSGMKDQLATALYGDGTGHDGKDMDGLLAAVDDATNVDVYGSITRSTYTWWKANYTALGGALTLVAMATMFDSCSIGSRKPNLIVTDKERWSDYEALLEDQIRYINKNGKANNMDPGGGSLAFRSTPVISDEYCPSGKMFFLNMETFKFVYLQHPDFPTDKKGFAMRDLREPGQQDGKVGFLISYHNLICVEPRANGQLDTIS